MIDDVLAVMQEAAETAILPRFRALRARDVEEKSPGEIVTVADREAEAIIARALRLLRPDAVVVGEEAAAAVPSLLDALRDDATVWLVDPLDGTSNFVAGTSGFAVMVALVEQGATTHSWVWRPIDAEAWIAQRGAGTTRNGERMHIATDGRRAGKLRGAIRTRFLDEEHRVHLDARAPSMGDILPGSGCAGVDYPAVITGQQDFVMYRRTLPWDHAPGALILEEAGGIARRWDGTGYRPGDGGKGLIAAVDEPTWHVVAATVLQERHRKPQT